MPRRNRKTTQPQGARRAFRLRVRTLGSARPLACPHCDTLVHGAGASEEPDCRHLLFIEGAASEGYRYACPELEEYREEAPRDDPGNDEPPRTPTDEEVARLCRCHVTIYIVPSAAGPVRVAIGDREE